MALNKTRPNQRLSSPLGRDLLFAIPFYEGAGTGLSIADYSGNLNNCTPSGTYSYVGSKLGWGIKFTGVVGTPGWVDLSKQTFLSTVGSFTICFAAQRLGVGYNYPRMFVNSRVNDSVTITETGDPSDGGFLFRMKMSGTLKDVLLSNVFDGTMQSFACVYDQRNALMSVYANGVFLGSTAATGTLASDTGTSVIGGESAAHTGAIPSVFNGIISYCYAFKRVLSVQEIGMLHQDPYDMFKNKSWFLPPTPITTQPKFFRMF